MASQAPTRAPTAPRTSTPPQIFRYERRLPERRPEVRNGESEPTLGPYETRYLIDMGYGAPPRAAE